VRILADTNIVAPAVRALREAGHDVVYAAERASDPGDAALLAEAAKEGRIFVSKDRDIGTLVHRDQLPHRGVLLLDDLGDADAEARLIVAVLVSGGGQLAAGGFLRVGRNGIREPQ
jgi:predicted nuclease of predicted toxin-antitoxin system